MRTPRLRTTRERTTWPAAATKPCKFHEGDEEEVVEDDDDGDGGDVDEDE